MPSTPGTPRSRFCIFHQEPTGKWSALRSLIKPGVFQYIVHLERLTGVKISSFHYIPMADDLAVEATYQGHRFSISMAWGGDLDLTASGEVPEEIFNKVCQHMKAYRRVWPVQVLHASKRYANIAKSAG